jgi:hypothetical protein
MIDVILIVFSVRIAGSGYRIGRKKKPKFVERLFVPLIVLLLENDLVRVLAAARQPLLSPTVKPPYGRQNGTDEYRCARIHAAPKKTQWPPGGSPFTLEAGFSVSICHLGHSPVGFPAIR